MPFVSAKDRRGLQPMTQPPLVAPEVKDDPTYGETFDAAVGLVIDEGLSVSGLLNQQQFHRRNQETRTLIDEGIINPRDYEYGDGKFDFNKLSRDLRGTEYEGRIQTDREARQARNEYLAMKRKYAESVLAEGPGMAQFLGSATAYMLDPINIATMGIGTVPAAAKGLTTAATALVAAKRTAGLVAASEAGIQAFVYNHKQDIESPYSIENSIAAIATAAAGAAALGYVTGGLTGYFRGVSRKISDELVAPPRPEPRPEARPEPGVRPRAEPDEPEAAPTLPDELSMADRSLLELADYVEAARADADPVPYQILDDEYGLWLRDEYESLEKLKEQSVKKLLAEQRKLSKSKKMTSWIVEKGGLNKESFAAEGIDPANFKKGFPVGFWRSGNQGMTADDLAEVLLESPEIYSGSMADFDSPIRFGANDAFDWVGTVIDDPQMYRDPTVQLRIDDLDEQIRQVEAAPVGDPLEQVYRDAAVRRMNDDIELLRELESNRLAAREPSRIPDDYDDLAPDEMRPVDMAVIDRERDLLQRQGTQESYDLAMEAYNALPPERRRLYIDGDEVDADLVIREIDDQLEEVGELIRCVRGG